MFRRWTQRCSSTTDPDRRPATVVMVWTWPPSIKRLARARGNRPPHLRRVGHVPGTGANAPCLQASAGVAGVRGSHGPLSLIRVGYDLFEKRNSCSPSASRPGTRTFRHSTFTSECCESGLSEPEFRCVEIPPVPAGHDFAVCLTHDIDFVGIRQHKFDHTMWGFVYRSTVGAVRDLCRGRISMARLFRMWRAAGIVALRLSGSGEGFLGALRLVSAGRKGSAGHALPDPLQAHTGREGHRKACAARRATAYDVTDLPEWTATLQKNGCELGVHGIDAWHSAAKGREELARTCVRDQRPLRLASGCTG